MYTGSRSREQSHLSLCHLARNTPPVAGATRSALAGRFHQRGGSARRAGDEPGQYGQIRRVQWWRRRLESGSGTFVIPVVRNRTCRLDGDIPASLESRQISPGQRMSGAIPIASLYSCALNGIATNLALSPSPEDLFDSSEIFLGIHSDSIELGLSHMDCNSMIEKAQLLKALGALQFRFGPAAEFLQGFATICVEPKMLESSDLSSAATISRQGRTAEVERPAFQIRDYLDRVRIADLGVATGSLYC